MLKIKCRWGDLLEDIRAEPFAEFHHALLMARWTKMATLAGEGQQVFVAAVNTFHTGKAVVRIAAVEIPMDYLFDIGPPETVLPGKMIVINDHSESVKSATLRHGLCLIWALESGRKEAEAGYFAVTHQNVKESQQAQV